MRSDSKKAVKEYFEENRTRVVGKARRSDACPLARFYMDVFDWEDVSVSDTIDHSVGCRYYERKLKPWQEKFIILLDARYNDNEVTGEEALQVLEVV